MDNNSFWANNISVLINQEKLQHFSPTSSMSLENKLNSLVRLSLYISIISYVVNKNSNFIYYPLITMAITYLIYNNNNPNKENLQMNNTTTTSNTDQNKNTTTKKPIPFQIGDGIIKSKKDKNLKLVDSTPNNPLANILLTEYGTGQGRKPTIDINNPKSIQKMNDNLYKNNFKDVNDIYNRNNSQRQFIRPPIQSIPNDRDTFMKWCYRRPVTCKEGNGAQCVANNYNPFIGDTAFGYPAKKE